MDTALTNLNFLNNGEAFPPPSQVARLNRYARNEKLFDNAKKTDEETFRYVVQVVNNQFRVVSYRISVNFYRLISKKNADMLFVEQPTFSSDETTQDTVDEINKKSRLALRGWETAIDVSRFGDAIYTAKIGDDGKGYIGVSSPKLWYPIVSASDAKETIAHVLAWIVTKQIKDQEIKELHYQIHSVGEYLQGAKKIEGGIIGDDIVDAYADEIVKTGFDGFAVEPVQNITTTSSIFGIDDYTDLYSLIDELQIRLEKNAMVLDKHSDPSMAGPASALDYDEETGETTFTLGKFFIEEGEDKGTLRYVTWDAQMSASFDEINKILELLAVLSEMGAVVFDFDKNNTALSGTALRLLYTSALTKVRRVRNNFDYSLKHLIEMVSGVGYPAKVETVSIGWKDGLPDDPKEQAEIGAIRTGGKATDSVESQIMVQDGLSADEAKEKYTQIITEEGEKVRAMQSGEISFFNEPIETIE